MEAACHVDRLPAELLQDISRLPLWQQLAVRQVSSRWRAAADMCLARKKELALDRVDGGILQTLLPVCPQVKRLSVKRCKMVDLLSSLAFCSQLRGLQMHIEGHVGTGIELFHILNSCGRLERLSMLFGVLRLTRPAHDPIDQRRLCSLTHLKLCDTDINDDTFFGLADLLPSLRHLGLVDPLGLTESGLASGLWRFTKLKALELTTTWFNITPASPVFEALTALPLEKLSCSFGREPEDIVLRVASVLRRCPTLNVLCLPWVWVTSWRSLVNELAADPPGQDEVTLFLRGGIPIPEDARFLPRNIRMFEYDDRSFDELFGWKHIVTNNSRFGN